LKNLLLLLCSLRCGYDFGICFGAISVEGRNQERRSGARRIRRRAPAGMPSPNPREGRLHGIGGAAPRDLLRETSSIEGRGGRHGRAGVLVGHSYAGPSSTRPVTIRRFHTGLHRRICAREVRAVRRSNRQSRKPRRHSSLTAAELVDKRHTSRPTSRRDVPPAVSHFMAISQVPISTDSFQPTRSRTQRGRPKPTWYMGGQRRPVDQSAARSA